MRCAFKKIFFLIPLLIFVFSPLAFAVTEQECQSKQQNDVGQGVACWEQLLGEVGQKKATLQSEIVKFNTAISLTLAKIDQTAKQIKTLETEIAGLTAQITKLDISLNQLSEILIKRIAATYKKGKIEPITLLFSSGDFSEFVGRYKYLRVMQIHDRKLMVQMENVRTNFEDQKILKQQKQDELEKAKKKLESQKTLLAQQKVDKENLLRLTQNDEKKYQQLLAQAYAEKAAIERALVAGTKVGPIKKGDPIALVGNTGYPGCSTGKHLHFEIRKNNAWTDPSAYLQNKTVEDDQNNGGSNVNVGSGNWPWPIEDTVRLTQFYGQTPYSWKYKYSGGLHTGYDMVSTSSDVIRAPADGTLFKSSQMCGSSGINIVYIEHGDNVISFYLHVQ